MKTLLNISILLLLSGSLLFGQTSDVYFENFNTNNEIGWAFLSPDAVVNVQNGQLVVTTTDDDILFMLPPIGATKNDFSIKLKQGNLLSGIKGGGIGRSGFKSMIAIVLMDDDLSIVYTEDIQSYTNPNFTTLHSMPIPSQLNELRLDVAKSGNNLLVNAFIDGNSIYSGEISNAHESLFYGQIFTFLVPDDGGSTQWSADEIDIHYNPYIETAGSFTDNFTNQNSPWFKFGDFDNVANSITIDNGNLNFNYNGADETVLFAIPPVGAVKDFIIECEGGGSGNHNAQFSISRFFDYKNYTTMFFDGEDITVGYAIDAYEPTIIGSIPYSPTGLFKIKFSVEGNAPNLTLRVWANDQLVITASMNNATQKVAVGHLALGFDSGNNVNAFLNNVNISYTPYLVFDNPFAGGSGTAQDPYLIANAEQLNNVRNYLDAHFRQIANVDLGAAPWNSGEGWNPIGVIYGPNDPNNQYFSGVYDGSSYYISNMKINRPASDFQGLFAAAVDATLMHILLGNIEINANNIVGGLTAVNMNSFILSIQADGFIYAEDIVGGLAGIDIDGEYDYCITTINIDGGDGIGGLVGVFESGQSTIKNSQTFGSVQGEENVGGLVGKMGVQTVENCYASGHVGGNKYIGGLIGRISGGTIDGGHGLGIVVGQENAGGLVGRADNNTTIKNSSTDVFTQGGSNVGGLVGYLSGNSLVTESKALGDVSGINSSSVSMGGLVGHCSDTSKIHNSFAAGDVKSNGLNYGMVGGLVGLLTLNSVVENCFAFGDSDGDNRVAGLAGQSAFNTAIYDSYARGKATGTSFIGGLVGNNHQGLVVNSYSTGLVTGVDNVGGLIGNIGAGSPADISNSYWNTQTSGQGNSAGGSGRTTADMTYPYATNTFAGWDYTNIWIADNNSNINNGYPYFRWYLVTDIDEEIKIPEEFCLYQNYPNPFNPVTTIKYQLPEDGFVTLKVYDVLGKEAAILESQYRTAGSYTVNFDASNLSSGLYIYEIRVNNFVQQRKMMVLK